MALRKIITVRPTALPTTADSTTWTTLAEFTVNDDCVGLVDWWTVGKSAAGNIASAEGNHRIKRIASVLSVEGNILFLLTFNTGSHSTVRTSNARINIVGDIVQLQVKGVTGINIEWDGGMILKLN